MEPLIKVEPPGPRAKEVLKRDARVISQSMVREYPLVLERGSGVNLWDVDGNRYLDFSAGIAVMSVGWSNPRVVEAMKSQLQRLTHAAFLDFCSPVPVEFAERLLKFMPRSLDTVYFSNSGAECIEAALKLARHHTKRKYFIAFYGGFHGRTYGALSLTSARVVQRKYFGPFLPVIHAPYPNPYRCAIDSDPSRCDIDVLRYIEEEIFRTEVAPDEVAAIVVEPVQGESGYVVPPLRFLRQLRELCDEHNILLVDDEVQAGCFRTGRFLAAEHSGIVPDIVCLSKAVGGGLPLGVTVASKEIMNWPPGSHASTFGGNAMSCAAGLAVLDIMGEGGFGDRVMEKGAYIQGRLREIQKEHSLIGDVRGLGLMIGFEFVRDRTTKEPAGEERDKILYNAFKKGLALLPAGESTIRICPPLTIEKEDIDIGLEIITEVIETYEGSPKTGHRGDHCERSMGPIEEA
jgi:4-aminobutyrate aminotransferase